MEERAAHWSEPQVKSWADLWCCLHDARLTNIHRDALARTLELQFKLGFPDPEDAFHAYTGKASITFEGLSHVRAFLWMAWPGERLVHSDTVDSETWNRQITEWQQRGCVETVGLEQFQAELVRHPAEVLDAQGGFDHLAALDLEGVMGNGGTFRLLAVGQAVSVRLNESPSSVEDLVALGTKGWDALACRRKKG